MSQEQTGADAVDHAISQGIDLDGSPIPQPKLDQRSEQAPSVEEGVISDLYQQVMALEANRKRSGVQNTMRSRIVRIGAKHIPKQQLNQMLEAAEFPPLKEKEIAFYYNKS